MPETDNHLENMMLRFPLLHRIEWTDRHPGLMFAAMGALLLLNAALERAL